MNKNVETHFSNIPHANIPRSRFDLSQDIKLTCDVGELIPWFVQEVYPGDSFDIETSKVIRLQTLLTPVMDNLYCDFHFWFVPYRLVDDHFKYLMGESQRAWIPDVEYTVPAISLLGNTVAGETYRDDAGQVETGDILDYMGVPVGKYPLYGNNQTFISALPLRAYDLIYSEWYRDENLIDPVNVDRSDATLYWRDRVQKRPYKVAKFHDVFTSALPAPQKGPAVAVPLSGSSETAAPVYTSSKLTTPKNYVPLKGFFASNGYEGNVRVSGGDFANNFSNARFYTTTDQDSGFIPSNLYADLFNSNVGLSIQNLRSAVAVQRFYEALSRGGSRYTEIIAQMFSVQSPDARLQRPEYLGGNRVPISIHQITNQSQAENAFLGDLGAMSLTTDRHGDVVKSFVEHGVIIGTLCCRYDHSYPQGLEKFWMRKNRFDFYWPAFAALSEEAISKEELFFTGTESGDVFGYNERYYDLRFRPNRVCGEMRPGISNTLDSWHFADFYTQAPTLSQSWIEEDKTNVDRTLAVTSAVSNQIFADIYVKNYATRPVPLFGVPGLGVM